MRRRQAPFHDPIRARHAVLLASVVGLKRASEITGINWTQICTWRKRIERLTGETFPRMPNPGNTGHGKLSLDQVRRIRERSAAGVSSGVLARLYKVHPNTIIRIKHGKLYPEPRASDREAG